jgi:hypothetical protein
MDKRLGPIAAITVIASASLTFAIAPATAHQSSGGVTPLASGSQVVQSGPGVYGQTTSEYAGSWWWSQDSAAYDYYWYVFQSNGVLAGSNHNQNGGGGSWSGAANIYYFKEYNNEPVGSGRINKLTVNYCC